MPVSLDDQFCEYSNAFRALAAYFCRKMKNTWVAEI
jgi:hypothetical protein